MLELLLFFRTSWPCNIASCENKRLLVKYAEDISLSIPVGAKLNQADSDSEVKSIMEWAKNNRMSLNLGKTWEMLMKRKTEKDQPDPLQYICLLYTSPSPRDLSTSRMPSSA